MNGRPEVRVFHDLDALSRAAAELIAADAGRMTKKHGRFTLALSGGSTPRHLYQLLGSTSFREVIDWRNVHLFWADERCVPPDHEESNYRLVRTTMLTSLNLARDQVHRIRGEETPEEAARLYHEELASFFSVSATPSFDLIILGAGEDGHTASLFPGSSVLHEKTRFAAAVHRDTVKSDRVTLTLPVLNHASRVLFLASGRAKAAVVHEIIEDGNPKEYPAGLVRPKGPALWMIDREAAGLLSEKPAA